MRGKRLTVIGAGLALGTGSACSLLTKLDAPIAYAPADGGELDAASFDATGDAPFDACSVPGTCDMDVYYAAGYVAQSFPLASTALTMVEGQVLPSYIELSNTGLTPWDTNTELGTTDPENRVSLFADGTWLAPDRPAAVKGVIAPGVTYKFSFDLQAPEVPGTYDEHFGLLEVIGTKTLWFSAPGQGGPPANDIEAQIVVVAPEYRGTFSVQSFPTAPASVNVTVGAVVTGSFQLTNTGTDSWVAGTTKLAPIPRDVASKFADPKWLSTTRISSVAADVAPGAVGKFDVELDTYAAGDFTVQFGLVEEGVTWFAQPTLGGGPPDGMLQVHLVVDALDGGPD